MFPDERFTTTRFAQFGQTAYGPPHARGTIVHRLGRVVTISPTQDRGTTTGL